MKRFFIYLTGVIVLSLFSAPSFSHAGSHENNNCFISIHETPLRFSGYQFQGLHPEHAYCRVFPYLGQIVIKIEPVNEELNNKKASLQLLKLHSWINWPFNSAQAFFSVKKTPLQNFNNGVNMIQADIQQRGVYQLAITLQNEDREPTVKTFLFLIGIPITELLVLLSGLILLIIVSVFLRQYLKKSE